MNEFTDTTMEGSQNGWHSFSKHLGACCVPHTAVSLQSHCSSDFRAFQDGENRGHGYGRKSVPDTGNWGTGMRDAEVHRSNRTSEYIAWKKDGGQWAEGDEPRELGITW